MPILALVLESIMALTAIYLAVVATVCVSLGRSTTRSIAALRIVFSWAVPILGAMVTIRVSSEESPSALGSRWWLWPIKGILAEKVPDPGSCESVDVRADAERIVPGITLYPPP